MIMLFTVVFGFVLTAGASTGAWLASRKTLASFYLSLSG